jgi:hypothetical protein
LQLFFKLKKNSRNLNCKQVSYTAPWIHL